MHNFRSSTRAN